MSKFSPAIKFIFCGHFHHGWMQFMKGVEAPFIIHPSISPIFNNNPCVRLYTIEDTYEDYTDYCLDLMAG